MAILRPRQKSANFGGNPGTAHVCKEGTCRLCDQTGNTTWGGIATTHRARLETADRVLGSMVDYQRKAAPERPAELATDEQLREMARKLATAGKLNKADREAMALFGTWRRAVFQIEGANTGNMILLLSVLNVLESTEGRESDAGKVRQFLIDQYQADIPAMPAPWATGTWAERWAERHAQDRRTFPIGLRNLTGGTVIKKSKKRDEMGSPGDASLGLRRTADGEEYPDF